MRIKYLCVLINIRNKDEVDTVKHVKILQYVFLLTVHRRCFFVYPFLLYMLHVCLCYTVQPVLSGHSKMDKIKVLKTNGSLMKVISIAECSLGAFCNTFNLH